MPNIKDAKGNNDTQSVPSQCLHYNYENIYLKVNIIMNYLMTISTTIKTDRKDAWTHGGFIEDLSMNKAPKLTKHIYAPRNKQTNKKSKLMAERKGQDTLQPKG